jgi:hypothetical protein
LASVLIGPPGRRREPRPADLQRLRREVDGAEARGPDGPAGRAIDRGPGDVGAVVHPRARLGVPRLPALEDEQEDAEPERIRILGDRRFEVRAVPLGERLEADVPAFEDERFRLAHLGARG